MVHTQLDQIPNSAKQGFHVIDEQKQKIKIDHFLIWGRPCLINYHLIIENHLMIL